MNPRTRKLKLAFDSHVAWRIAAFAEKEGRSLTSSANHLVNVGWASWSGDRWDQVAVANARPEPEPLKSESRPTNVLLPLPLLDELHRAARAEKRTVSSMIRAMIREGLDRRKKIDHINTRTDDAQ
jgi:hypothetical protein